MEKETVLILGNGISRLHYKNFIRNFKGEIWGCNFIYLDYGKLLSRITGHSEVLYHVKKYKKENNLSYEIWGGNLGLDRSIEKFFTVHKVFCKDSGTTLVAQALHEGKKVKVLGFDLGGLDIYSPNTQSVNKFKWVVRWKRIIKHFGKENIQFIGHDHMPFLLSNEDPRTYYEKYSKNIPHINTKSYEKLHKSFKLRTLNIDLTEGYIKLKNSSKRKWEIKPKEITMPGKSVRVPENIAFRLRRDYPGQFTIIN